MTKGLQLFGHDYHRARKTHQCWTCGRQIEIGERYFKTKGTIDGAFFSVKHCRTKCECTAELIDQNPQVWPRVLYCDTLPSPGEFTP